MTYDPRAILQGLDASCMTCQREIGIHTLREWSACTTEAGHVDPFHEPTPEEAAELAVEWDGTKLRIADHLSFVAAGAQVEMRGMGSLYVPLVIWDFGIGQGDGSVEQITRVGFTSTVETMRSTARQVRDACNAAANKAEHAGRRR